MTVEAFSAGTGGGGAFEAVNKSGGLRTAPAIPAPRQSAISYAPAMS
jgi:hypothetical protein